MKRAIRLATLMLLLCGCADFRAAGRDIGEGAKSVGAGMHEIGQDVGEAVGGAARTVGREFKEAGEAVGAAAADADEDDAD